MLRCSGLGEVRKQEVYQYDVWHYRQAGLVLLDAGKRMPTEPFTYFTLNTP